MKSKKSSLIAGILLSASVLAACGGNDAATDDSSTGTSTSTGSPTTETANQTSNYNYNFRSFDLDIDTAEQNDAIDASFEEEKSGFEAEYENKIADLNVKDGEAMEHLDTIFSSLDFDQNTPDEEVIQTVSETFGGVEYTNFELEVEFKDGTEREYKDTK